MKTSAKYLSMGVSADIIDAREYDGVAFYVLQIGMQDGTHTWEVEHRYSEFKVI